MNPLYQLTANTAQNVFSTEFVDFGGRRRRHRNHNAAPAPVGRIGSAIMSQANHKPASVGHSIMNSIVAKQQAMNDEDDCSCESSFGGRGAKRREKRQEARQARKMVKAESKAYKREAKGDKKRLNGESNLELAKLGINGRAQLASGILGGMAKVAGAVGGSIVGASAVKALPSLLGGGGGGDAESQIAGAVGPAPIMGQIAGLAPQFLGALGSKINQSEPMEYQPEIQQVANSMNARYASQPNDEALEKEKSEKEKSKNNMMIFGGIGAVLLIGIIVFIATKK
jgi:predicted nucleic acid-binding Zn ribbon protein